MKLFAVKLKNLKEKGIFSAIPLNRFQIYSILNQIILSADTEFSMRSNTDIKVLVSIYQSIGIGYQFFLASESISIICIEQHYLILIMITDSITFTLYIELWL